MKKSIAIAMVFAAVVGVFFAPAARAQDKALTPVTVDLRDSPIRAALDGLFRQRNVDFQLDPAIDGFVTIKLTEQPFETALRLILRSATTPLTYRKEGGIFIVEPRKTITDPSVNAPAIDPTIGANPTSDVKLGVLQLTYADPYDLQGILQIQILDVATRTRQGTGGGGGQTGGAGGRGGGLGGGGGFGGGGFGGGGGQTGGFGGGGGGFGGGGGGFGGGGGGGRF